MQAVFAHGNRSLADGGADGKGILFGGFVAGLRGGLCQVTNW